jgi:hypothetical protein
LKQTVRTKRDLYRGINEFKKIPSQNLVKDDCHLFADFPQHFEEAEELFLLTIEST